MLLYTSSPSPLSPFRGERRRERAEEERNRELRWLRIRLLNGEIDSGLRVSLLSDEEADENDDSVGEGGWSSDKDVNV